jgi:hypothetical protein
MRSRRCRASVNRSSRCRNVSALDDFSVSIRTTAADGCNRYSVATFCCTHSCSAEASSQPLPTNESEHLTTRLRYSSRNASGTLSRISGGSDAKSVAQVWRQLAHFSVMTVMLFMRSMLPTC